jgi:hypothetical protein
MLASQIVDIAEARFNDSNNAVYDADEWLEYVNDAYQDIVSSHQEWPFPESRPAALTVAAQAEGVDLPDDTWRVIAVYNDTEKVPMDPIPGHGLFRRLFPDPAAAYGTPLYYRLRSNTLEVYPRPNVTTSIVVDVYTPPADLTASDAPVFPAQYHRILVLGALVRAYEDDGALEQAGYDENRFQRMLMGMKGDLLSPRHEGYPPIVDTFF